MKICPSCHEGVLQASELCPSCSTSLGDTHPVSGTQLAGMVIDQKYRLTNFIQEGGMAWIYRGEQQSLGRPVAIKLMKPTASTSARRSKRFIREATTAARLLSPHIVLIIDTGITAYGLHYIVSEYVEGINLGQLIASNGPLPLPRAVCILNQIFAGVEHAHSHGVIHRDLKPDNIMITRQASHAELVKVLDFGVAWVGDQGGSRLTVSGEIVGTPAYMAPEQIRSRLVGAWTDIYALGVIIYEMLTGMLPFEARTVESTLKKHLFEAPPSILDVVSVEQMPAPAAEAVQTAMSKNHRERFGSVTEMRDALFGAIPQVEDWLASSSTTGQHLRFPLEYSARARSVATRSHQQLISDSGELLDAEGPVTWDGGPDPQRARASSASGVPETWLVGRDRELTQLLDFSHGEITALELVAPAGRGKSALLCEANRLMQAWGVRVLQTGRDPRHTRSPWYPVRQLVCQALRLPLRPTADSLREVTLQAPLVPEDLSGLLTLFNLSPAAEGLAEVRFREAICSALRCLGCGDRVLEPVCLVIDDADDLDSASRRFVVALRQAVAEGEGVRLLTAARSRLPGSGAQELRLEQLGRDAVEELLARRLEDDSLPPKDLVDSLLELTAGDPLFLVQAMHLLDEGQQLPESPASFKELVRLRLASLPRVALHVLRVLCLLGDTAPRELVRAVLERQPEEPADSEKVEQAMNQLEQGGWVERVQGEDLTVCHSRVAEVVHAAMDTEEHQRLHQHIYDELQERDEDLLHAALHAGEFDLGQEGLQIHERAGDMVRRWLDDEAAGLIHYRRALHVARWELAPDVDGDAFFELSLKLAGTLLRAGHLVAAEEGLKGATDFLQKASPAQDARLLVALGQVRAAASREKEATARFAQVIERGHRNRDDEALITAYRELGELVMETQGPAAALELYSDGARKARGAGRWRLLLQLARLQGSRSDPEQAVASAREALGLAWAQNAEEGQARIESSLGQLLRGAGNPREGAEHLAAATVAFLAMGDRRRTAQNLLLLADPAKGGRPSEQLALKALALARQVRWPEGQQWARKLRGGDAHRTRR